GCAASRLPRRLLRRGGGAIRHHHGARPRGGARRVCARDQGGRRDHPGQPSRRRRWAAARLRAGLCAGRTAAGLAGGNPLAAAGAMGRAPWRRAPARTPPHAAARTFLADPLRAAGGGRERAGQGGGRWQATLWVMIRVVRLLRVHRHYPILTTIRPRTPPSTMRRPASVTPDRSISPVRAASFPAARSVATRLPPSRGGPRGHITESTPMSDTPRRMNGATVVGRSIPPANPQAATAPP